MIRVIVGQGKWATVKQCKGTLEAKKAIRAAIQADPRALICVVEVTETQRPDLLPTPVELVEWCAWRAKRDARQKADAEGAAVREAQARLAALDEERANLVRRLGGTS